MLIASSIALAMTAGAVTDVDARPRPRRTKKFEANKTFGLGLMVGAPTALSGKYFYAGDKAFDFGIGTVRYWRGRSGLHLHADHLWHPVSLISDPAFEMPLYLGIGFRLFNFDDDYNDGSTAIGLRVPVGIAIDLNNTPMDFFFELALVADFLVDHKDNYDGDLEGALGFRFYLN